MNIPAGLLMSKRALPWIVAATVAFIFCAHGRIDATLVDPFHEGEYLSTRLLFGAGFDPPLLIHGYMDYVPARLAELFFGADAVIAGTRLVNLTIGWLASFAFLGCLLQLARGRGEVLGTLLVGGATLFVINGAAVGVVDLHQGSPSVRDLFLFVELWLLLAAANRQGAACNVLAAIAGLVAGFGLFWAYNRGVTGLAALAAYICMRIYADRHAVVAAWPVGGALAGSLLCLLAEGADWSQHIANILYWQRNGHIWQLALSGKEIGRTAPLVLACTAILAGAAVIVWRFRHDTARRNRIIGLGTILPAAAFAYFGAFARIDVIHLNFMVPYLVLLGIACWTAATPLPRVLKWRETWRRNAPVLAVAAGLLIHDFSAGSQRTKAAVLGIAGNARLVLHGLPLDEQIAQARLYRSGEALRAGRGRCTYVFDGSAVLYHLSGRPSCSSIMIPHYTTGESEGAVIADMARARPPLVVGRSNLSNNWFDGQSLAQRLPRLHRWMTANYVPARSIEGIEIWRRRDLGN